MNPAPPVVSVIIRCCNEEQHIGRLLSGILEQSLQDVEIILVDSGSTDATLAIASRYPVQICHIARAEFSFGRSPNVGCAAARGQFLVLASARLRCSSRLAGKADRAVRIAKRGPGVWTAAGRRPH